MADEQYKKVDTLMTLEYGRRLWYLITNWTNKAKVKTMEKEARDVYLTCF